MLPLNNSELDYVIRQLPCVIEGNDSIKGLFINKLTDFLYLSNLEDLNSSQLDGLRFIKDNLIPSENQKIIDAINSTLMQSLIYQYSQAHNKQGELEDVLSNIELFGDLSTMPAIRKKNKVLCMAIDRIKSNAKQRYSSCADLAHFMNVISAIGNDLPQAEYLKIVKNAESIVKKIEKNRGVDAAFDFKNAINLFVKKNEIHMMPHTLLDHVHYHPKPLADTFSSADMALTNLEKEALLKRNLIQYCFDHLAVNEYLFRPSTTAQPFFSEKNPKYFFTVTNRNAEGLQHRRLVWEYTDKGEVWGQQGSQERYSSLHQLVFSLFKGQIKGAAAKKAS